MFEAVPIEHIGEILDRVLAQLGLVEKIHDLADPEPPPAQVGGYTQVEVPEWTDEDAWGGEIIGFK